MHHCWHAWDNVAARQASYSADYGAAIAVKAKLCSMHAARLSGACYAAAAGYSSWHSADPMISLKAALPACATTLGILVVSKDSG